MKQKWIAGLLAVSMMAAMAGCAETTDSSSSHAEETSAAESSAAEETEAEDITEAAAEETEFQVELLGTSVSQDYEGKPVLVVEYNFTNNSDEAQSFIFACQDKVFQNGIECDDTVIGCDDIDSQQQMNEIQPGTTYALKIGYHLQDTTSPVDIEVTSLDFINEDTLLKQTVNLQ
ncbi:MAG: DUF5067 domain-containing protein [Ruminococcus sp.]|jgi:hypothetical protein|uniref:DUF5067 domain-containing protein n=1 Tax=uncultured Ruminococcus sp. TaxID=165186 RepID=UPI0026118185|nr:DUF5067 domain-containing protein [uncultured Ruminococcus sp.]